VVVHDVEDHLDAGAVKITHHCLKLRDLGARTLIARIARGGGEEAERAVTPVVGQTLGGEMPLADRVVDGQELDRGDAEPLQILEDHRRRKPGVRAAQRRRDAGVPCGEALDVELVDQRPLPRNARGPVIAPHKARIHHDAPRDGGGIVARIGRQIVAVQRIAEQRIVPIRVAGDRTGVGIDEELGRIEAMSFLRGVGAVDSVAVELAGTNARHVGVPDPVRMLDEGDAHHLTLRVVGSEKTELDPSRMLREDREIHPSVVDRRAERKGCAGPYLHARGEYRCPIDIANGAVGSTSRETLQALVRGV